MDGYYVDQRSPMHSPHSQRAPYTRHRCITRHRAQYTRPIHCIGVFGSFDRYYVDQKSPIHMIHSMANRVYWAPNTISVLGAQYTRHRGCVLGSFDRHSKHPSIPIHGFGRACIGDPNTLAIEPYRIRRIHSRIRRCEIDKCPRDRHEK